VVANESIGKPGMEEPRNRLGKRMEIPGFLNSWLPYFFPGVELQKVLLFEFQ
jgi:hypothetical protein